MESGAEGDRMPGGNESGMDTGSDGGASGMRDEITVMEHRGRVESVDASNFEVKDDDGETFPVDKKVVFEANERGENFKVGARVAFTTPRNGSEVLSLGKLDEDEDGTGDGEAVKEADQATKSA